MAIELASPDVISRFFNCCRLHSIIRNWQEAQQPIAKPGFVRRGRRRTIAEHEMANRPGASAARLRSRICEEFFSPVLQVSRFFLAKSGLIPAGSPIGCQYAAGMPQSKERAIRWLPLRNFRPNSSMAHPRYCGEMALSVAKERRKLR